MMQQRSNNKFLQSTWPSIMYGVLPSEVI